MDLISVFGKISTHILGQARRNVEYCEHCRISLGIIAVISFPLYYFVWHDLFPQPYENLPLRLLGGALFTPMMLERHWPAAMRKYLPWYWYGAILFGLPFFFSFMMLKNGGSTIWAESTLVAMFLMVLLLGPVMMVLHSLIGAGLAWAGYYLTTDPPQLWPVTLEYLAIALLVMAVGTISNQYAKNMVRAEREQTMLATAASIAQELRTPLLGVRTGAAGLRNYLPALIDAYRLASEKGLTVSPIRTVHLDTMKGVLNRIEAEAKYSNIIIDILLANARFSKNDVSQMSICSMARCVDAALTHYPFSDKERALVSWQPGSDFDFLGSSALMEQVLFNLLKNALRHIANAGKGEIKIQLENAMDGHRLIFLDTGSGIPPEAQPHVFRRFYRAPAIDGSVLGSGIGMAFCQDVMQAFGGAIECTSVFGEFTKFVLIFPEAHHESI